MYSAAVCTRSLRDLFSEGRNSDKMTQAEEEEEENGVIVVVLFSDGWLAVGLRDVISVTK